MKRCFDKINDDGGINGRKIKFLSYDDAYNPSRTVEQSRKLVDAATRSCVNRPCIRAFTSRSDDAHSSSVASIEKTAIHDL